MTRSDRIIKGILSVVLAWLLGICITVLSPTYAQAQSKRQVCATLEKRLSYSRNQNSSGSKRIEQLSRAFAKADRNYQRSYASAAKRGCLPKRKLFGNKPKIPKSCVKRVRTLKSLDKKRRSIKAQLNVVNGERKRGVTPAKTILRQLVSAGCPGYRTVAKTRTKQNKGLAALFLGKTSTVTEFVIEEKTVARRPLFRYRTVCVRKCDGYFFPVSELARKSRFGADEDTCSNLCPGAESELFLQKLNAADVFEDMRSLKGEPYSDLENAFKFQTDFVQGCRCQQPRRNVAFIDPERLKTDLTKIGRVKEVEIREEDIRAAPASFALTILPMRRPQDRLDIADFANVPKDRPGLLRAMFAQAIGGQATPLPKPETTADVSVLWLDYAKLYPDLFAKPVQDADLVIAAASDDAKLLGATDDASGALTQMEHVVKAEAGTVGFSKGGVVSQIDGRPVRTIGPELVLGQ